jgi:hypothetical protein
MSGAGDKSRALPDINPTPLSPPPGQISRGAPHAPSSCGISQMWFLPCAIPGFGEEDSGGGRRGSNKWVISGEVIMSYFRGKHYARNLSLAPGRLWPPGLKHRDNYLIRLPSSTPPRCNYISIYRPLAGVFALHRLRNAQRAKLRAQRPPHQ